jgi:hypothetical protein
LAVRKNSFKKAVETKQLAKAEEVAAKLGKRYNTARDLELLKQALNEKQKYETLVGSQSATLKKFGGTDWAEVEKLVTQADAPGDPSVAIENFPKAGDRVKHIRSRIDSLIGAEEAFFKVWNTSGGRIGKYFPDEFQRTDSEIRRIQAMTDPAGAEQSWKSLSRNAAALLDRTAPAVEAKRAYDRAVQTQDESLLKQYAADDLAAARKLADQAELSAEVAAAAALWKQAETALGAAVLKLSPKLSVGCNVAGADIQLGRDGSPSRPEAARSANAPYQLEKDQRYTLTVSAKGYKTHTEILIANWYGVKEAQVVLKSMPIGGDARAVDWEEVNERWVKNIYVNGDITMSDKLSGTMWLYDADSNVCCTWDAAIRFCDSLNYAGYSDWYLPDIDALKRQYGQGDRFSKIHINAPYWSSTPHSRTRAWGFSMKDNGVSSLNKDYGYYVWPMRSGR